MKNGIPWLVAWTLFSALTGVAQKGSGSDTTVSASKSMPTATLNDLLEGPGGPRYVTEIAIGKITEKMEAKYSTVAAPYVLIYSERVVEKGKVTIGVHLVLAGLAYTEAERKPIDIAQFNLLEAEARQCAASARMIANFTPNRKIQAALSQEYLRWQSDDGLIVIAGIANGKLDHNLATTKNHGPILSLTVEQMKFFADEVDKALATAAE